ncbi:MAG TPA: hypothetical protein VK168_03520 [Saprospiraceae bacterium]|nr:hypothetical protein [Saprospiraceae bacterium]
MLRLLLFCLFPVTLGAQNAGKTDLLLCSLRKGADSLWRPDLPKFMSAFNRGGYNNQPSFFSNNELWLTVQYTSDTTQTDIVMLDLAQKTQARVTATPQTAEYSPTLMPGGKRFSVVRVEEDGNQRLWSFPIDRSDNGRVELSKVYNVGYHCWLRDTLLALFIVGDEGLPHTLQSVGLKGQKTQKIASNIGRCLVKRSDGKLLFVQKPTEQTWFLKTWDPQTNTQEIVVKMPSGTEDFAMLPDGTLLAGNGVKLFQYKAPRDTDWKEVADFSKYGIRKITRLAVSKDGKLALVVN